MPIRGEGLIGEDDGDQGQSADSKVAYVLHPNCGIFDGE